MKSEDIWDNDERMEYKDDDYYECFQCGFMGNDPMIIKEYGMEFYLCENCGGEVF